MAGTAPTLSDIAQAAGVSIGTVSRVLRGQATVSPATARRITAAAERLRYRPNLLVQGMQTGRTRTIGVMVPVADLFYGEVVAGIHDALTLADHAPVLLWSDSPGLKQRPVTELEQLHRLIDRRVDGLIIRPVTDDADDFYLREASDRQLPVVTVDRELVRSGADFVGSEDVIGGQLVAKHLLSLGHRRVGHLAGALFTSTGKGRHDGFVAAIAAAGATCLTDEDPTFSDGEAEAMRLLTAAPKITALFCCNDLLAAGAYRAAARLKISIPHEVSVVGFADMAFAKLLAPPLTTVRQDAYRLGQEAAARILARCDGDRSARKRVLIPVHLMVRASTAPVTPS